ncbi:MAG: hypothetical protein IIX93_00415, partial [Clostridia bacterium]|nr:hypothetical protein [Clostridia bacterium]
MNNATWDLSVFYNDFSDVRLREDIEKIKTLTSDVDALLVSDRPNAEKLLEMLSVTREIDNLLNSTYGFIELTLATDANCMEALRYLDEMSNLMVEVQLMSSKFIRFVGGIENLEEVIESSEELKVHRFYIEEAKESAAHMLPEDMEKWVLRLSLDGADAFAKMRDRLMGNHTVELDGESLPLPAVRGMAYDPDPAVRKKAYEAEIASYKKVDTAMAYA